MWDEIIYPFLNYIDNKMWDEIIYPFSNINSKAMEVWEWTSYFISHFTVHVITYPCWFS